MLKNRWGEFNSAGTELLISDQRTPFNWNNFFFSRDGLCRMEISQRGGGGSYYNYDQNMIAAGRTYFLRDQAGSVRSLTGMEAPDASKYSICRQLPGRSIFETRSGKIESVVTIGMNPDSYAEINHVQITNRDKIAHTFELTACQFIRLAGADNGSQLDHTEFHPEAKAMAMRRYHSECAPNRYAAYFVSRLKPESFCGSRDDFFGADVTLAEADAVRNPGKLANQEACATPPVFAMRYTITIPAGETFSVYFELGIADTIEEAVQFAKSFTEKRAIDSLKISVKFYKEALKGSKIKTPDDNLNIAYNCWTRLQLFHQNLNGRNWNVYLWRNHLQDGSGNLQFDPQFARKWILQLCALTQADGFVPRTTAKGKSVPANMAFYFKQRHNDIGCWLGMSTAEYILETGDLGFLDKKVFNPARNREISVLEAVEGGLIWTLSQRGIQGFIRFLDGDWSDPLEKAGRRGIGESCWTAMAAVRAVKMFGNIMRQAGYEMRAERLEYGASEVANALNRNGWDGKWYIRGITDDGVKFCTAKDPDAKISMLVQAWAVLADVADSKRKKSIMNEVAKRCMSEFGPALYGSPYLVEREGIGRESAKRPGCGENGSCYTHGSMMLAAAHLEMGDPDGALEIIQKTVSIASDGKKYDIRHSTPLWWCNYYQSPYGAQPGRSSNFTSSGAPAWFVMNLAQRIFGLKPEIDGLKIAPCLPKAWHEASLERVWRGSTYHIKIKRTGKNVLKLDGKKLTSNLIPPPKTKRETHHIEVEIE
ncbi:MAG: hypothetical protein LBM70_07245 [Victivallales bacterium]|jgi:cellobionic acid phosphorylase|nr:hypothetical protein [Victivallales bacterium]